MPAQQLLGPEKLQLSMRGPAQPVVLDVPVAIEGMDQRVQLGHRTIILEPPPPEHLVIQPPR
jgi:hypothetical protein